VVWINITSAQLLRKFAQAVNNLADAREWFALGSGRNDERIRYVPLVLLEVTGVVV
jgi:hypothetical protein